MKQFGIVFALVMGAFGMMFGQQVAPQTVLDNFSQQYPNAGQVNWYEEDGTWEASFIENGTEVDAKFDIDGKWAESEKEIVATALPQAILNKISADFGTYAIKDAEEISSPWDTRYEVELKLGTKEVGILFDSYGTIVEMGEEDQPGETR